MQGTGSGTLCFVYLCSDVLGEESHDCSWKIETAYVQEKYYKLLKYGEANKSKIDICKCQEGLGVLVI